MRSRGFVFLQLVVFLRTCLLEKTWLSFFGFLHALVESKAGECKVGALLFATGSFAPEMFVPQTLC